jgi:hypothetical protein
MSLNLRIDTNTNQTQGVEDVDLETFDSHVDDTGNYKINIVSLGIGFCSFAILNISLYVNIKCARMLEDSRDKLFGLGLDVDDIGSIVHNELEKLLNQCFNNTGLI